LVVYGGTNNTNENITSPNYFSAMAKTVGYPAAIAAKMVLDGKSLSCFTALVVSSND